MPGVLQYAIVKMVDGKPVYMNARGRESRTPEGSWLHASPENVRAVIAALRKREAADYQVATVELKLVELEAVTPPKHAGGWVVKTTSYYYADIYRDIYVSRGSSGVTNIESALVYKTEAAAQSKAALLQTEAEEYAAKCAGEVTDPPWWARGNKDKQRVLEDSATRARERAKALCPTVIRVESRD